MSTAETSSPLQQAIPAQARPLEPFHHEAFFYANDEQYLRRAVGFITEGLEAGEAVMVAVPGRQHDLIAENVAPHERLRLENMEEMGRNPAWIIPAWNDFAAPHVAAGRHARGIGEPIWSTRSADELVECCRHESLLNLAFQHAAGFKLLCPYDMCSLRPELLDESMRNHPVLYKGGVETRSHYYRQSIPAFLDSVLPEAPTSAAPYDFGPDDLEAVRTLAATNAASAGLSSYRIDDLLVVVREAATNSLRHGGGKGAISFWSDGERFICEIKDTGRIEDPLAGRVKPLTAADSRGLWLINQMCDLVQVRSRAGVQTMRLHMAIG